MQKLHKGLYLDEIYFSNGVFRGESPIQYYCRNITTPPSNLGAVAGYSNDDEKVKIHSRRNIKLTAPYARRQICYPKGVVEHYNSICKLILTWTIDSKTETVIVLFV